MCKDNKIYNQLKHEYENTTYTTMQTYAVQLYIK
jgi:hypothetical protein